MEHNNVFLNLLLISFSCLCCRKYIMYLFYIIVDRYLSLPSRYSIHAAQDYVNANLGAVGCHYLLVHFFSAVCILVFLCSSTAHDGFIRLEGQVHFKKRTLWRDCIVLYSSVCLPPLSH